MKNIFVGCVLVIMAGLSSVTVSSAQEWEEEYNKDGITISTTGEGIKTFKVETTVEAPINACISLMQDITNQPKYLASVASVEMDKKVSDMDYYLYYVIDLPFPYKDRDIYTRASFEVKKDNSVDLILISHPDEYPDKDRVRMKVADGFWKFIPEGENKTKILYQFKSDPTGVPAWIVNQFITDSPLESIKGFKKWVLKKEYWTKEISWL